MDEDFEGEEGESGGSDPSQDGGKFDVGAAVLKAFDGDGDAPLEADGQQGAPPTSTPATAAPWEAALQSFAGQMQQVAQQNAALQQTVWQLSQSLQQAAQPRQQGPAPLPPPPDPEQDPYGYLRWQTAMIQRQNEEISALRHGTSGELARQRATYEQQQAEAQQAQLANYHQSQFDHWSADALRGTPWDGNPNAAAAFANLMYADPGLQRDSSAAGYKAAAQRVKETFFKPIIGQQNRVPKPQSSNSVLPFARGVSAQTFNAALHGPRRAAVMHQAIGAAYDHVRNNGG